jgi:hypothetical protein
MGLAGGTARMSSRSNHGKSRSAGGSPAAPCLLNQSVPTPVVKAPRQPAVSRKHRLSGLRSLLIGMRCDGCRRDASRTCGDEAEVFVKLRGDTP